MGQTVVRRKNLTINPKFIRFLLLLFLEHMQRSVEILFRTPSVVTDITGNIPSLCKDRLPYALAERTILREGTMVAQFYSHFLFFIEVIDVEIQTALEADYLIKNTSLFLFMMLEGQINFSIPDSCMKMEVSAGSCYATYNREGKFTFAMPKGKHTLCYILPRTEWVYKNIRSYPRLEQFLNTMKSSKNPYGHLPACTISKGMDLSLHKLFRRYERAGKDLEAVLLRDAKRVMYHYQALLGAKLAKRVYLIRDYMERHLSDPELSNASLSSIFHVTEKTMIETFKAEFGITPYKYLIQLRMDRARQLLELENKLPSEVCFIVGYTRYRSFRAQFVKTHSISPQGHHKPTK